ncbi:GntR family transcriptional regulator [Iocasia frigidifontis]|nr:GntR family transcriptional regulator [Iocasia fonsfrigidae]
MEIRNESDFFYKDIKNKIKDKIAADKYESDGRIPSERELCSIYDVSRTTIRRAIDELVEENFLIKRPGKGTYIKYNNTNKHKIISKKNTGNIIFLRCSHHDPKVSDSTICDDIFYPKIMAGIDKTVTEKKYHCIVKYLYENSLDEDIIDEIIKKADGIICGELHSKKLLNILLEIDIPLVLINPSVISSKVNIVEINNFIGAYDVIDYLVKLGHRKIGFIGGASTSFSAKYRKYGYLEALNKEGIKIDDSKIISYGWRLEDGYKAAGNLLELKDRPTAIFAVSDLLAIGAINAIKDSGLLVPDDISVIGFDDIDMASQIKPSLTTMKVRKFRMGEVATELIFEQLNNNRDYYRKISISTDLQVRDSVKKL